MNTRVKYKRMKNSEFPWWLRGWRAQHSVCEDAGSNLSLTQWVKDPALQSCDVGRRHGSDPAWLWPAAAVPIWPLAWELPYATGVAGEKKRKKNGKFKAHKDLLKHFKASQGVIRAETQGKAATPGKRGIKWGQNNFLLRWGCRMTNNLMCTTWAWYRDSFNERQFHNKGYP